tara:strand:- start:1428 stop:1538 length:111 start_codon:yes stop_codon:yes gene_type:complete
MVAAKLNNIQKKVTIASKNNKWIASFSTNFLSFSIA